MGESVLAGSWPGTEPSGLATLLIPATTAQHQPAAGWARAAAGGQAIRHPLTQRRRQGLAILVIGWGLALLALWHSRLWLWELNESWDPRPVATQVRALPADAPVWLKGPPGHPSAGTQAEICCNTAKVSHPKGSIGW